MRTRVAGGFPCIGRFSAASSAGSAGDPLRWTFARQDDRVPEVALRAPATAKIQGLKVVLAFLDGRASCLPRGYAFFSSTVVAKHLLENREPCLLHQPYSPRGEGFRPFSFWSLPHAFRRRHAVRSLIQRRRSLRAKDWRRPPLGSKDSWNRFHYTCLRRWLEASALN
jgi:hypothetical protein